jgi:hypothetical protein
MPFTPKTWAEDDPITPAELNRIETGVDDAHAGKIDAPRYAFLVDGVPGTPTISLAGWAVERISTGFYRVTAPSSLGAYTVQLTAYRGASAADTRIAVMNQRESVTQFTFRTVDLSNAVVDAAVDVLVGVRS